MKTTKESMTCVCAAICHWLKLGCRLLAPLSIAMVFAVGLLCGSVACAGILTLSGMPTIDPSRMINCNGTYYIYSTSQLAQSSVDRIH